MTDKYGSEAETHEQGTEHDPAAGAESWQGDQPPVDDFADPDHVGTEGAATVSEEGEAEAMVDESVNPPKKSSFLPMVGGLLVLAVVGGGVWYQFLGGAAILRPPVMNVAQHKVPSVPAPGLPQTPPPSAVPASPAAQASANDINNLKPPSAAQPAVPLPTPNTPPSGVAVPSPGIPSATNDIIPPQQPSAPPLSAGSLETQVNALSTRLDVLQKSLDQASQQLNQLNGTVTALQAAPATPPNTAALEDRLNKIEQDVMKLEQATPPAAMAKPLPIPAAAVKPPAHHTAKPKATLKSAQVKPVPHPAAKPAEAAAPVSWVLRAATPGEAWVSQGASSSELKHIQVGDDLPGIGHVTAIRQNNGRWTIEGSKGTIQ